MVNSPNYSNSHPTQFFKGDTEAVGWFVTTKKALALVALAIFTLIFVIVFMYYYGPNRRIIQVSDFLILFFTLIADSRILQIHNR